MAAPANEMLRELARLLDVAADSGEPATRAGLQAELGVGAGELAGMLELLREHGQAVEVAPGEWRAPLEDEADLERAPVQVRAEVTDRDEERAAAALRERDGRREPVVAAGATVRLTPAVADALDAQSLGNLVKAGIDEAKADGSVFVLEVGP